ncbi:hypothetical protein [Endozoicomonas sp. YOMI1]|nr:hypothetical protein [Endozoicomonas sp. YOMI1]
MHQRLAGMVFSLVCGPVQAGLLDAFTGEKQAPPEVKPFKLPPLTGE